MAAHSPGVIRRRSLFLLVALLPMLTYLGHWPRLGFDVPLTGGYWELPFVSGPPSSHHGSEADEEPHHAQHCHADSASCLNGTAEAIAFGALLAAFIDTLGADGPSLILPLASRRLPQGRTLSPDRPPPRLPA